MEKITIWADLMGSYSMSRLLELRTMAEEEHARLCSELCDYCQQRSRLTRVIDNFYQSLVNVTASYDLIQKEIMARC